MIRSLAAITFGVTTTIGLGIAGVSMADYVAGESQVSTFADMDGAPIWTAKPVVVNTQSQEYARLPARLSTYAIADLERQKSAPVRQVASLNRRSVKRVVVPDVIDMETTTASVGRHDAYGNPMPAADDIGSASPATSSAHVAWCEQRYNSYDAATDSYRSYSGEVRPCVSPAMDTASVTHVASSEPSPQEYRQAHIDWCGNRYRSYRVSDNTYQPYGGGRETCVSPYLDQGTNMASR